MERVVEEIALSELALHEAEISTNTKTNTGSRMMNCLPHDRQMESINNTNVFSGNSTQNAVLDSPTRPPVGRRANILTNGTETATTDQAQPDYCSKRSAHTYSSSRRFGRTD